MVLAVLVATYNTNASFGGLGGWIGFGSSPSGAPSSLLLYTNGLMTGWDAHLQVVAAAAAAAEVWSQDVKELHRYVL